MVVCEWPVAASWRWASLRAALPAAAEVAAARRGLSKRMESRGNLNAYK